MQENVVKFIEFAEGDAGSHETAHNDKLGTSVEWIPSRLSGCPSADAHIYNARNNIAPPMVLSALNPEDWWHLTPHQVLRHEIQYQDETGSR